MAKLLVVDDEAVICQSFQWVFGPKGIEVLTARTLEEGWRRTVEDRPDVIVLDLQLPDGSGLDLFTRIRDADPKRPVVFITAHGTTETAIETMKYGAYDYLTKPLELEEVSRILDRAFAAARLMREPAILPNAQEVDQIVGRSKVVQELCKHIGRVASQEVNVLILGESGVGKELVARAIFQHSRRADQPFLAINCAAIPETLVESELFGHERGAFTGATRQQIGKFEQASGGTILLDEIGDMPLSTQAKLLRIIQEQQFERVGGRQTLTTHVRILAATNQDLEELIAASRFRADLYYRLKDVPLRVPPLRDRPEDIPELSHHFLFRFVRETDRDIRGFAPMVMDLFQKYPWPGNVRELRGVVREAAVRATGPLILPEFLPVEFRDPSSIPVNLNDSNSSGLSSLDLSIDKLLSAGSKGIYGRIIGSVERDLIARVLHYTNGHQGQACELLGIDRKTLRKKMRDGSSDVTNDTTDIPNS